MIFRALAPRLVFIVLLAAHTDQALGQVAVTLTPSTSPSTGEPGVTNISVTGSGFPTGTTLAASVTVTMKPVSGGATVTTPAIAVTTVIGSTRRVTFRIPASVSVLTPTAYSVSISGTTSSNLAFASSNSASLTVNPAASITMISPSSGQPGQNLTVAVTGSYSNFLQGVTIASFGAGITVNSTTVTNATQASVSITIASNASTGPRPVTLTTGVEVAGLAGGFSVTNNPPTITDFNPKSGSAGALVTITGTNLQPNLGTSAQISLAKQGGGSLGILPASAALTSLSFVIPSGAATGTVSITVNGGIANTASPLAIVPSSGFTLTAMPSSANLIQGQSVAYSVQLSSMNGFNQLALLNVSGVPTGVTASFNPTSITAGQTSVLTLTAPAAQATGSAPISISAGATVNGLPVTQTASTSVSVVAPTTTLLGRTVVSDSFETPLAGVTVKTLGLDGNGSTTGCIGHSTISDGAGNFALANLPMQCTGPQLIGYDGTTATAPSGKYAGVNLVYTLVAGQVTPTPVLIHLPRIDSAETFLVQQNASVDQTYAFKTVPNLSVTVYAGTTFTMPDGTRPNPFPLAAINVPVDRLPDIKPPVPTMITAFIVAFQPANATANQPVAVYYPNELNTPPGSDMALLTLDPTHGAMVPYGTGAVSADGSQIVPDLDPSHPGHRYGLVHFDWHMPGYPTPNQRNPCCVNPVARTKHPIDLSTGLEVIDETDISFGGSRGTISIQRVYRNGISPAATTFGPFGYGTNHNYSYELGTITPSAVSAIPLIMPDGNQFIFSAQGNGIFVSTSGIPALAGATMTVSGTTVNLRWKGGTVYQFNRLAVPPLVRELLTSITDPNGNTTQLLYNGFEITDIIDPAGRDLHFNYSVGGCITQITAPDGRAVSYNYGGTGSTYCLYAPGTEFVDVLRVVTHPDGTTTRYDYDVNNNLTAITDGRGVVIASNTYDANNRVIQQKQANGGVLQFSYALQNPTAPLTSPVMSTTVTDALGRQTTYRFGANQALLSVTDPLGQMRVFTRDGNNNVTSVTGGGVCDTCSDPTVGDQNFSYDGFGNLLSETDALGNTTSFTYDPTFNKVTSAKDPLGNTTMFTYDSNGNPLTQTDANGNVTKYQYDSFGELTQATDALGQNTILTYDGFGNIVGVKDPLGNLTSLQYDSNGRLVTTVDALGRKSTITYDAMDRITGQTNAQGGVTTFAYDPVGNLLSVQDARGNTTSFTYDLMNGLVTRQDPLGRTDKRSYDLNENLTQFQDRRGQTSTFTYDADNRLTTETYPDAVVTRSYDANDRVLQVGDSASGIFGFTYDIVGRLLGSTTPFGSVQYARDTLGRVSSRQVVGQPALAYMYDPAGNLTSAAMPTLSVNFTYDARNHLSNINRVNGVSSAFAYDPATRLLSITHAKGSTILDSEAYSYDGVGNRVSHATGIGQPLTTTAVPSALYDADNEQVQFGSTASTFDANGNLISTTNASGTTTFTWDSRNRLKSIVTSSGQTTGFTYDFAGNLLSQADSGPALNLTKSFVLDDLTDVALESASDGTSYSVLSGQSIDSHLGISQSGGQIQYRLADAINSTVATVDGTGAISGQFLYEPFGQVTTTSTYPFQYTGRTPVTSSLDYNRARFYNSQTGRFISEDPIGGLNPYRYVSNNPAIAIDPLGLLETRGITQVAQGLLNVYGGVGALLFYGAVSETGVGAVLGLPLAGYGLASAGLGLAQIGGEDVPESVFPSPVANTLVDAASKIFPELLFVDPLIYYGQLGIDVLQLLNARFGRKESFGGSCPLNVNPGFRGPYTGGGFQGPYLSGGNGTASGFSPF